MTWLLVNQTPNGPSPLAESLFAGFNCAAVCDIRLISLCPPWCDHGHLDLFPRLPIKTDIDALLIVVLITLNKIVNIWRGLVTEYHLLFVCCIKPLHQFDLLLLFDPNDDSFSLHFFFLFSFKHPSCGFDWQSLTRVGCVQPTTDLFLGSLLSHLSFATSHWEALV